MRRVPPFRSLDVLRGFAALWVVIYHSCGLWFLTHPAYKHTPFYIFALRGQLGVVLFFVISGYCITAAASSALASGKTVRRYFQDRIRRIYPPYVVSLLLTVAATLGFIFAGKHHLLPAYNHTPPLPLSFRFWIGNLLLLQPELHVDTANIVFWSLCYEVAFYVIIGLFLYIARKVAEKRGLSAGVHCFVATLGLSTLATVATMVLAKTAVFPFDLWHQFSLGGLLFFFLESIQGKASGYGHPLRWNIWTNCLAATALTLFFIAFREVGYIDIGHPSSKIRSSFTLLFCLFLILLKPFDEKVSASPFMRPWMWLGAFSYSLYLFHAIVIAPIDAAGRRLGFDGPTYWVNGLVQIAAAILVGRIMFLLVERHFISNRQKQRLVSEQAI